MNKKAKYLKNYYLNNKERIKKQKADWYRKNRERLIIKDDEYKRKNKDKINEVRKFYPSYINHIKRRDPFKTKVRDQLTYAVKIGKIKRLPCEICGEVKSQSHHPDYSKPFEVVWLCAKHHAEAHKDALKTKQV